MKQLLKLFPVMLMIAAISVAGCGEKGDTDTKEKEGASEKKDDAASTTSPNAGMVATKVSLPNMDWT